MDPDVSVLLDCALWHGLVESEVQVELSTSFNRHTDSSLDCHIDEVWTDRVAREPWLFNGSKFRLHSFTLASAEVPRSPAGIPLVKHLPRTPSEQGQESTEAGQASGEEHQRLKGERAINSPSPNSQCRPYPHENRDCVTQAIGCLSRVDPDPDPGPDLGSVAQGPTGDQMGVSCRLTLRLGLTCYKDFLGTNWSCQAGALRQRGEAELGDPCALLAQPLGVAAVLCTSDGDAVLIRRSRQVAEAGGLLDIPGGHPEPQAVCPSLGDDGSPECLSETLEQLSPEGVVAELFCSVQTEIRDEVNVPLSSLGSPVLMGVALNQTSAGRPSAEFYVSCSLSSEEVRELYWRGGAEASESTDIFFLSTTELLQLDRSRPLWSELCPSAKGAVLLYQLVRPDTSIRPEQTISDQHDQRKNKDREGC